MVKLPSRRQSLTKQLDALLSVYGPRIRGAFMTAVDDVKSSVVLAELVKAIENGDADRAFRLLGFNAAAMRPITAAIEQAYEAGGNTTAATFPRVPDARVGAQTLFRFDIRNTRAEKWIADRSGTLITRITDDQRTAVRDTLFEGLKAGQNPKTVALDIVGRYDPIAKRRVGGIVGLTTQQERALARMRVELSEPENMAGYFNRKLRDKRFDSFVRQAMIDGKPLDAATASRLLTRYGDNMLRYRGETIGRTEALQSLNQSSAEAFKQVVESGGVPAQNVKRIWDSAGADGRTRDTHLAMDGQTVGMDEPFTSPSGARMMFPGDGSLGAPAEELINCRCIVRINVDWLAGVK